ncbi:hypothetical protein LENED_012515 [Lentinula edodes]|uniref:Uncharacterized protein n=1 Tax=Lentinula edodes TaxID=5353 RepID=A0A1Q3EST4_LENED|nr:hypothetical protein LENED_012515 [Lentinula edodes]
MAAAFSNSEHNYPYLDSAGYPHLAPSSYEVQDPNFYAQKSSEFHYQPTYDEIQYSSLIQESGSINSEHHRLYEDSLALESQFACRPDYVDDVPQSVFSWPVEYFVAPAGADFVSESFLLSPSTPDFHSPASTGSLDESFGNVFDMQFVVAAVSLHRRHQHLIRGHLSDLLDNPQQFALPHPLQIPVPVRILIIDDDSLAS